LQQRLVKRGGPLVKHARYYWLLLAKSHLTRRLFGMMLRRIGRCPRPRAEARRLPQSDPGNETRGERCPRKCFGTEVQSIGYQCELGLAVLASWKIRREKTN
jgi:hypothetical protein